jgi:ABC-2 type transport system ATP-binding protein
MFAIQTKNLVKTYKNFQALKDINFEIQAGDFFALLGVNGAGKSTIIGILTDLVKKTSGKVEVFWVDIDTDFSAAKSLIGVVPQELNLDIFSRVIDVLTTQAGYHGISLGEAIPKAETLLEELGLWEKKESKVMQLSWGMKRRLMIARALIHSPKLLILDEPTAGIDINLRKSTYEFLQKLNASGTTILLTTHYLEEVEKLCNSLAVIKNGEIIIHSSKKDFFARMENNSFEIEVENMSHINEKDFETFHLKKFENFITVEIPKSGSLNPLLQKFLEKDICVKNIKNTTNELEHLFESLTK